jgi:fumarylacetoacetate (FAA) hydrolase
MKFATLRNGHPDGKLLIVSRDLKRCVPANDIARNLREALESWDSIAERLESLYEALNSGRASNSVLFDPAAMEAPLPRSWQWLDGSAYPSHGELMQVAYDLPAIERDRILMYQGMSHQFLSGCDDVPFVSEADGIDFEGEIGIITGPVPIGTTPSDCLSSILLLVLINDWSLRVLAPAEMKTGFGWIQAKPACSMAAVAITPDELGTAWRRGRIDGKLEVTLNGTLFGSVPTGHMALGFHSLVAHAARTRSLCAGTIIGSGTVSSPDYRQIGSCCIAERRAIEKIDLGSPITPFLIFGDRVEMTFRSQSDVPILSGLNQFVMHRPAMGQIERRQI